MASQFPVVKQPLTEKFWQSPLIPSQDLET